MSRFFQILALSGLLAAMSGCGTDYAPPELSTTGLPAEPVGQVLDLEVSLPNLMVFGAKFVGVELEMRLEFEQVGYGELTARVFYEEARVDMGTATVEDLSSGTVEVVVTPTSWNTRRIGPVRIENTMFEMILGGETEDGGWTLVGESWESQTSRRGPFRAWRRSRFLVTSSDFFSSLGRVAEVALVKGSEIRVRNRLELVSSDAVLRATGGAAFAINRLGFDNLQRLDPTRAFATTWQAGMGSGANPHDVLLLPGDRGYVTRYEPPFNDVAVFDAGNGRITATIPLGPLAENEHGTPRAERMREVDGTVFVGLQDVDRTFTQFEEGKLAVVDPLADEVVDVIRLGGKNPGAIDVLRGEDGRARLYVALAGIFPGLQPQELSGGVVVVDAASRTVEGQALDDDVAGGNIASLAMASERRGYVVVSDASFTNRVLAFDPTDGSVQGTVRESVNLIPEIEVTSSGVLAVPDRAISWPKLCLYSVPRADGETEQPLGCGTLELPPFSVEPLD